MPLDPVLRTKLFIPPFRSDYIPRPHLLDRINAGIKGKLIFVFAPAGYGKTTLVAEWTRQANLPTAWLSLDHTDRDPITFYQYLITCLQAIFPKLGEGILITLGSNLTAPTKNLAVALINEIFEHADDFVLVLDDFHRLTNPDVIQIIDTLISELPPQMHVIITSRSDLPFSYARMRSQGEVTTIGIDELRFQPQEISAYLHTQLGEQLNATEEEILKDRSEGWIAGLHMAVLSLQSSPDLHNNVTLFSGEDRYVSDYLIDEVLSRQNPDVYQFLIQTSILDKLTAELCNNLTGLDNSQTILEYLDRSGIFIFPLDNTRSWYRYHHLFVKLLKNRLNEQQFAKVAELHRCAAEWFGSHNYTDEAIEHWLIAEDYQRAVEYIESNLDDILALGKFSAFLNWLDRIPNDYLINHPKLILYQLFQLWEMGYLDKFYRQMQIADEMMGAMPESPTGMDPEIAGYHGILAVIKILTYAADYKVAQILEYLPRIFCFLPEEYTFWRLLALAASGFCNRVAGNNDEAARIYGQVISLANKAGAYFPYFMYSTAQAHIFLATGELTNAINSCKLPLSFDAQHNYSIPFSGLTYAIMGELLYLGGEFDTALDYTRRSIEMITNDGEEYSMMNAFFTLAKIYVAQGDPDSAIEAMDSMIHRLHEMNSPTPAIIIGQAYQANIWILCDRLESAISWTANTNINQLNRDEFPKILGSAYFGIYCTIHEPFDYYYFFIQKISAQVEFAAGNVHEALDKIDYLLSRINDKRWILLTSEIYILKALVLAQIGASGQDLAIISAIQPLVNEPCYQIFIREGNPMRELLEVTKLHLSNKASKTEESHQILNCIDQVLGHISTKKDTMNKKSNIGIASFGLTPRENIVLQHLSHGVSYKDIAGILTLSPNTIKTHVKRIYQKMGVTNRLQAVNKARELGWFS
jgi:LuxR family transcriptional regulator, maltose regulon positive regulatory protein